MSLLTAGTITLNDPLHGKVTVNEHYLSKHPFHANTGVKKNEFLSQIASLNVLFSNAANLAVSQH